MKAAIIGAILLATMAKKDQSLNYRGHYAPPNPSISLEGKPVPFIDRSRICDPSIISYYESNKFPQRHTRISLVSGEFIYLPAGGFTYSPTVRCYAPASIKIPFSSKDSISLASSPELVGFLIIVPSVILLLLFILGMAPGLVLALYFLIAIGAGINVAHRIERHFEANLPGVKASYQWNTTLRLSIPQLHSPDLKEVALDCGAYNYGLCLERLIENKDNLLGLNGKVSIRTLEIL